MNLIYCDNFGNWKLAKGKGKTVVISDISQIYEPAMAIALVNATQIPRKMKNQIIREIRRQHRNFT